MSDPLDTATGAGATTTDATASVADTSTPTTTDTTVSATVSPTDTAAPTTPEATAPATDTSTAPTTTDPTVSPTVSQTDATAPTTTPTDTVSPSPTTGSVDSSITPTSPTDTATATATPTTDSVDASATPTISPTDGATSSPAPGDSLDPSSTSTAMPTTDVVQSTASALPSAPDSSTLTSSIDPAATLGSVVPNTDLTTAPAPDTTLTSLLDPTGSDTTASLTSILPNTDLTTAPAPDTTLTSLLNPSQLVAGAADPSTLDAAALATGIDHAGAPSLAEGMVTAGSGNEAIGSMAHELASTLAASTHPAVEGTAHAGGLMSTGIDGSAASAASAAGSGGIDLSLPILDPTYLRYVGLAGLVGLTMQSAARWAEAAGGCGVPTRLALRQFRLLPCVAIGSVERVAHAALAVGAGSTSGTAGQTSTRSRSPRGGSRSESFPAARTTMAPSRPSSGATQVVEIVLVTALVLLNFVLLAIRDTFRRNNGA